MKQIPLTKGQFAMVDDEMYDYLIHWKWAASFSKESDTYYAVRFQWYIDKYYCIYMHRFILGVTNKKLFVDHINHDGLCNLVINLRIATSKQSSKNIRSHKNSESTYKGVSKYRGSKRNKNGVINENGKVWRARITIDGKPKNLGYFKTEIEAATAVDKAAKVNYGEFAYLNFPTPMPYLLPDLNYPLGVEQMDL